MPIGSESGAGLAPDPVPEYAAWRKGVAGVLAKARRVEASELPAEPEHLLDETTYDGLTIAPLYTRRDELPEQPLPGAFPYVRGGTATRDPQRGWFVSAFAGAADAEATNRAILSGLENGVSAVALGVGAHGVTVEDVPVALRGLLFELAPLTLVAGKNTAEAAARVFEVLDGYEIADRAQIRVGLGAAPLTSAFTGADDLDEAAAVALAQRALARAETVRAITVDGIAFHNAGAADAQEVGAAIAAGLAYLRALTAAGVDIADAFGQLEFRFAATDDQFATIVKFRAARRLWARVAQVCGAPAFGAAPQHAVTSAAMMTQRDPWVNLLRTTLAAFGAGVGGADSVTVLPFDSALPAGELGVSQSFSERMARNIQLLLLEESRLGHVQDPAAGSWYVDALTDELAAKAWEFMQELEAAGGYQAALSAGLLAERIAETAAARGADVAHRKTAVTGVNEFPNLAEPPLSEQARAEASTVRYGAAFEALRNRSDAYLAAHGARPKALIVPLGPVAEHNARTIFTANVLASGGIESVNPGPLTLDGIAAAAAESGARIAVLCGADKRYGEEAGAAVDALRGAGIDTVLLAGPEKSVERYSGTQRPDGYLTLRIDAVAVLSQLLEKVGA
ncbi:putative methylmalonyl-CoA mutase small subunit MutA [Nocardia neocaledoniensis NBRC 108232]|uniref:Heterodimeric methylmalonyl-CoA mutase small subunit n=1 Tax=Nocardia neocaledoniensis TaxID=236511 RepID=A0A317NHB3_9NOCA|nr:methylmalonyl-CoA mutase family protein [Nocardia neocaledoniensis]PWV74283.1 heterodimeric methylmalonyl-CoA mutase small subunit [Nocardia neocaledoniensis]GEM34918.1 putative methylmalonyl-CoA mutase small subunit MutA [Nocardia neocaledoniensis NBRC 108232]